MSDISVILRIDGEVHEFSMESGGTILSAAHAAGIAWPSQCEAGMCATCRGKLVSGEVEMLNNMVLDDDDLEKGFVLVCQAVPTSRNVTLELDDS